MIFRETCVFIGSSEIDWEDLSRKSVLENAGSENLSLESVFVPTAS